VSSLDTAIALRSPAGLWTAQAATHGSPFASPLCFAWLLYFASA